MMAWRDKEIIPLYNAGGVSKFAFITGEACRFQPSSPVAATRRSDGPVVLGVNGSGRRAGACMTSITDRMHRP
jgi:hypothetical protein